MRGQYQKEIICAIIAIAVSAAIGMISIRIWEIDLTVLPKTFDDAMGIATISKSIAENGIAGIYFNNRWGAPETASLIDYPYIDLLLAGMIVFVNLFTSNGICTAYIVYLLGFPLTAASMYFLLSYLNINRVTKIVISIIYAVSPFHFLRGIGHLALSNYFTLPLGIYLSFIILDYKKWKESKIRYCAYACAVLLGLGSAYYAFFVSVILGIALVIKLIKDKDLNIIYNEARYLYIIVVGVLIEMLPKIIYSALNGKNYEAAVRYPSEAEHLGLKIIQLFLPPIYSRIGTFRNIAETYQNSGVEINENVTSSMGLIASVGFLLLCVWFFITYLRIDLKFKDIKEYCDFLTLSLLVLLLLSLVGGFGVIFNSFVTPLIRGYCRVSILITGICLTMLAICCEFFLLKIKGKVIYYIGLIIMLGVGLYDQVKIEKAGWQDARKKDKEIYSEFFGNVENMLKEGDMIYQLPYMDYPEADFPIVKMGHYSPFLGYIYTDNIRWSYGGMKGRNTIAKEIVCDNGMSEEFLENLEWYGFAGVCIDTYGFEDEGVQICKYYDGLNTESLVSGDGRFYFYILPPKNGDN